MRLPSHYTGLKTIPTLSVVTSDLFPSESIVPGAISLFGKNHSMGEDIVLAVSDMKQNEVVIFSESTGRINSLSPADLGEGAEFQIQYLQGWNISDGNNYLAISGQGNDGQKLIVGVFGGSSFSSFSVLDSRTTPFIRSLSYGEGAGLVALHAQTCTVFTNYNQWSTAPSPDDFWGLDVMGENFYFSRPLGVDDDGGVYRYRGQLGTEVAPNPWTGQRPV